MIHLHELQKTVGNRCLFSDLTLFLPKASYTLLCGEKYSGKTTLVRMLLAYERPDNGTLTVDGIDIGSIPESRIPYLRRQIGLIAETPTLLEDRSVIENIAVPLQLAGFEQDIISQRTNELLQTTGLNNETNTQVSKLTDRTRQLVSAARAVIHKPTIVVADEPLRNVDNETAGLIVGLLNDANSSGATVLITCQSDAQLSHLVSTNAKSLVLTAGSDRNNEHSKPEQEKNA